MIFLSHFNTLLQLQIQIITIVSIKGTPDGFICGVIQFHQVYLNLGENVFRIEGGEEGGIESHEILVRLTGLGIFFV